MPPRATDLMPIRSAASSEMTHIPAPVSTTKRNVFCEPLTRTWTTGRLLTSSNGSATELGPPTASRLPCWPR